VTGNHDRDGKINMVRLGMMLASPFARSAEGRIAPGRMYLNNGRGFATLAGPDSSLVQFVFVPYPFPSRYDFGDADIMAKEQLHLALQDRVVQWLQKVTNEPLFSKALPTVVIGHLHVRGAELHTVYKMNAADDVQFEFADLNPSWSYIALGHIHKPQMVGGSPHVRYPGSLDRLDITESHEHGAILFDLGPSGLMAEPQWLPIPATPFHAISIANLDEDLPGLAEKFPDRETAIVRIEIAPHSCTMSRDEATRQLRRLFPRCYDLRWLAAEATEETEAGPRVSARASLETTVRDYLAAHPEMQKEPEAEQAELRKLAESFLTAE
jgi:DNA repair protein SbcD/Mre11